MYHISHTSVIHLSCDCSMGEQNYGLHELVRNSLLEGVRNVLLDFVRNFLMENVLRERYMVENVRNLLDFVRNFL